MQTAFALSTADTDLLVNLSRARRLDLLRLLFPKVLIPKYIVEKEIKPLGKKIFAPIWAEVQKKEWLYIIDPDKPNDLNPLQKKIYSSALPDLLAVMDSGEAHGMALAQATGASFFLSNDNGPHHAIYRAKTLEMAVRPLNFQDILFLAKVIGKLSITERQEIHDLVRSTNKLTHVHHDIKKCMESSFKKLVSEPWLVDFLECHEASQAIIVDIKRHQKICRMENTLSKETSRH